MIGVDTLRKQVHTLIRRSHLVGGHTTKQSIRPSRHLTRSLKILTGFLTSPSVGRRIVTIEDASLNVGREEISKRYSNKQDYYQHLWQPLLQTFHTFIYIICVQRYEN